METINLSNQLIADFMQYEKRDSDYFIPQYNNKTSTKIKKDDLKFHKSWDWLMPVIDRIEKLGYSVFIFKSTSIFKNFETLQSKMIVLQDNYSRLRNTYLAVITFIYDYNNKKI